MSYPRYRLLIGTEKHLYIVNTNTYLFKHQNLLRIFKAFIEGESNC